MYPQLGLGPKAFEQQLLNTTDCFLYMLYAKGKPHIIPTITLCKFARLEAIDSIFLPQKLMVSNITQTKQWEKKQHSTSEQDFKADQNNCYISQVYHRNVDQPGYTIQSFSEVSD